MRGGKRRSTHIDAPVTTDLVSQDEPVVDPHRYVLIGWGLTLLLGLSAVALVAWFVVFAVQHFGGAS